MMIFTNKKAQAKFLVFIILILTLIVICIPYSCQIQTYRYNYEAGKLKEEILGLKCYNSDKLTQEYFDENCKGLIDQYNEIVKKWSELSCVDYEVSELTEYNLGELKELP